MFKDRVQAAKQLAERLQHYKDRKDALVVAIPRGGVVTGEAVAKNLGLPLDIVVVRKLGHPWDPELAAGAVDADGEVTLNAGLRLSQEDVQAVAEREKEEIVRRVREYKNGEATDLSGKNVILADDGIATGQTLIAAVKYIKRHGAARVIVAAPVASPQATDVLKEIADEVVVLDQPENFMAVGQFYEDFPQVSDQTVKDLLK